MELWLIVVYFLIGCAIRFILPYVLLGLEAVAEQNRLSAWPAWEWRYLTAIIVAVLLFGLSLLVPATLDLWRAMAPVTIILAAYAGQDASRGIVKVITHKR